MDQEILSEETQSEWSKPWFIWSAVLFGLLVVAAVVVIVVGSTRNADIPAGPGEEPGVSETKPEAQSWDCPAMHEVLAGRIVQVPEVEWQHAGSIAFPVSTEFGPQRVTDAGVRVCFARSPEGAVLAATSGMTGLADPDLAYATAEARIVPGAVRDEMLSAIESNPPSAEASQIRISYAGFKLLSYDGDRARVDLGVAGAGRGESVYLSTIVPLEWVDGDWQLAFDELSAVPPATLPSLAGYSMWKQSTDDM